MESDKIAIRTAIPFETCCKITDLSPSATSELISTPRLTGPGCITIPYFEISSSLFGEKPYKL